MRLRLTDRRRGSEGHTDGLATFRTCLRAITFIDDGARRVDLEDGAAYAHLVEVVCGLQSPMAGETQIQGQFKAFLDGLDGRTHAWLKRLGQQVLADARVIREAHLRDLGSRTYGSAVRRHVRDLTRVALIGAGVLAREIHDYIDAAHVVDVWTRATLDHPARPAARTAAGAGTAVVIAAPIGADAIARVRSAYPDVRRVLDLRADDERTPIADVPVLALADLFSAHQADGTDARLCEARAAAARCGRRFDAREELHPFGWEDLCA